MAAAPLTALGDRTFGSLRRHRNYRLYFVGNGISFIGTWMQQIAAYWLDARAHRLAGRGRRARARPDAAGHRHRARGRVDRRPGRPPADGDRLRGGARSRRPPSSAVLALTGHVAAWQLYALRARLGRRRRARHPRPAHARLPDRRSGRPHRTRSRSARASARRRGSSAPPSAASSSRPSAPASRSASTRSATRS